MLAIYITHIIMVKKNNDEMKKRNCIIISEAMTETKKKF